MNIPRSALKFILFQRTLYLERQILRRISDKIPALYGPVTALQALLFSGTIREKFEADMRSEYESIKPALPAVPAPAILDIGSGVAGIDVFLAEHYNHEADIHLLDKTALDSRVYYKFESRGSLYNSLDVSRTLLMCNGVPADKIHLQEATDANEIQFGNIEFDLVLSLISWGFHYPVSTYADAVYSRLKKGGVLIIDVRKGQGGEEELVRMFGNSRVLLDAGRMVRLALVK